MIEAAPGFRPMLVSFDPLRLTATKLVDHLRTRMRPSACTLPGRQEKSMASKKTKTPVPGTFYRRPSPARVR